MIDGKTGLSLADRALDNIFVSTLRRETGRQSAARNP